MQPTLTVINSTIHWWKYRYAVTFLKIRRLRHWFYGKFSSRSSDNSISSSTTKTSDWWTQYHTRALVRVSSKTSNNWVIEVVNNTFEDKKYCSAVFCMSHRQLIKDSSRDYYSTWSETTRPVLLSPSFIRVLQILCCEIKKRDKRELGFTKHNRDSSR